jgi:hypothetical protein
MPQQLESAPAGNEHTYQSLEEMPPDIRAAFEDAQRRQDDDPKA